MKYSMKSPYPPEIQRDLINYLIGFITPERHARMQAVLAKRTRYLTVVLEDLYQAHNASAVLRSCDGFGVQDVHIVEGRNSFRVNEEIALGTAQWLTLHRYKGRQNNSREAVKTLRKQGYRIVATSPRRNDVDLQDFDLSVGKIALFFGTEKEGLSNFLLEEADEYLKIPMDGFVESFNISVSAAIILHHLTLRLRSSEINWRLPKKDTDELLFKWLCSSLKRSEDLIERFFETK
jgi:tRNA (guanosine-2'-O-)-methyltransferase